MEEKVDQYVVGHIDTLKQLRVVLEVFERHGIPICRNNHKSMDDIDLYIGTDAGLFDVNLGYAPTATSTYIGFRCVARPQTCEKAISVTGFLLRFGGLK